MKVIFEKNGITKEVKSGFSWTTFFFSGFPQLFRGEILIGILLLFFSYLGVHLIYAFFANKITARRLIGDGWSAANPSDPQVRHALSNWGVASK